MVQVPDSKDDDQSGDPDAPKVGAYDLVRPLGRGSRGVVWLARHRERDRDVALKIVSVPRGVDAPGIPTDWEAIQGLRHPSVVRVFEGGITGDPFQPGAQCLYYAMEAMPHGSLADQLAKGPLDPIKAARLMREVCRAVAAGQRQGLLHLDIKPSNILLDGAVPKLADFSFAIPAIPPRPGVAARPLGTIGFLSPEQSLGRTAEISPRSDVYGICATLMALVTGSGLGDDESTERVRRAHPELIALLNKGLEREPDKRFRSAVALGLALDEFLGLAEESKASPPESSSPPWVLIGIALLAGFGLIWRFSTSSGKTSEPVNVDRDAGLGTTATGDSKPPSSPAPGGGLTKGTSPHGESAGSPASSSLDNLESQLDRRDYGAALQTLSAEPPGSRTTWTDRQHLNFVRAQIGAWLYEFSYHPHDLSRVDELFQSGSLAKDIARAIRTAKALALVEAYPFELKVLQHLQDMRAAPNAPLQVAISKDLTEYPQATELLLTVAMLDLGQGLPNETRQHLDQLPTAASHPGRLVLRLLSDLAIQGETIPPSLFHGLTDRFPILKADLGLLHLLNADVTNLPQAVAALKAATIAYPDLATAHHHLAVAQQRSGDAQAALQTLGDLVQNANANQSWLTGPTPSLTPASRTSATYQAPSASHLRTDPWLAPLRQHPEWLSKVGQYLPESTR